MSTSKMSSSDFDEISYELLLFSNLTQEFYTSGLKNPKFQESQVVPYKFGELEDYSMDVPIEDRLTTIKECIKRMIEISKLAYELDFDYNLFILPSSVYSSYDAIMNRAADILEHLRIDPVEEEVEETEEAEEAEERASSDGGETHDTEGNESSTSSISGKLNRKKRTFISKETRHFLESVFRLKRSPNSKERRKIAEKCGLTYVQVRVWFTNKRMRSK